MEQVKFDLDFFLKEGEGPLNENLEEFIGNVVGKASALKGMTMLKEYEKLKLAANSNKLDFDKFQKTFKIDQAIRKIQDVKDGLEGPAEQKAIAKIQKLKETKSDLEANFDLLKEKAANQLAEIDEKLKKLEAKMGGKFKEMYDTQKTKVNAEVSEKGLEMKAQMLKAKGKDDAAKEAAAALSKAKAKNAEMEKTIQDINIEVAGSLDADIERVEAKIKETKEGDLAKLQAKLKEEKEKEKKQKEAIAAMDPEADKTAAQTTLKSITTAVKTLEDKITKTEEGIENLEGYLFDLKERKEKTKDKPKAEKTPKAEDKSKAEETPKAEDKPKDEETPEVKKHKAKIKEFEDAIEGLKNKKDKKSKNDLGVIQAALKAEKKKLEKAKKSNESNLYEGMSISDKFRILMNK